MSLLSGSSPRTILLSMRLTRQSRAPPLSCVILSSHQLHLVHPPSRNQPIQTLLSRCAPLLQKFRFHSLKHQLPGRLQQEQGHDFTSPTKSYDHKIDLEPGTSPPFGPIYFLSEVEQFALARIPRREPRQSDSFDHRNHPPEPLSYSSRRKDGSLRLAVDYRGINRITKKDRYPLPLIPDLLDRLRTARFHQNRPTRRLQPRTDRRRRRMEDCVSHSLRLLRIPRHALWPYQRSRKFSTIYERHFQGHAGRVHSHLLRRHSNILRQPCRPQHTSAKYCAASATIFMPKSKNANSASNHQLPRLRH
jgi:hypothetical protein